MSKEKRLSAGAGVFLIFVGVAVDAAKFILLLFFGIGLLLNPVFITPIATLIFWITLNHNGISMFSGKAWKWSWGNLIFSIIPGIDGFPDWSAYAIYLNVTYGDYSGAVDMMRSIVGIMS